ncbi:MAG TPA: thioesterase family protein [Usitatibacter sp.]|nr:thioesterase family protein [Usitatibacter sp.]
MDTNAPRPPRPTPTRREAFPHLQAITTRWLDNDAYGHVNNAVYFTYFDTVVNTFLIGRGVLDVARGPVIGVVVDVGCHYFASLAYPEAVTGGLRVAHIGGSSVRYEIALFGEGREEAAAQGHFVHVYVDRETRRPVRLPDALRAALQPLVIGSTS